MVLRKQKLPLQILGSFKQNDQTMSASFPRKQVVIHLAVNVLLLNVINLAAKDVLLHTKSKQLKSLMILELQICPQ